MEFQRKRFLHVCLVAQTCNFVQHLDRFFSVTKIKLIEFLELVLVFLGKRQSLIATHEIGLHSCTCAKSWSYWPARSESKNNSEVNYSFSVNVLDHLHHRTTGPGSVLFTCFSNRFNLWLTENKLMQSQTEFRTQTYSHHIPNM